MQGHSLNNCAEHSHETNTLIRLMERLCDGQSLRHVAQGNHSETISCPLALKEIRLH